jgi:hypothetical protein
MFGIAAGICVRGFFKVSTVIRTLSAHRRANKNEINKQLEYYRNYGVRLPLHKYRLEYNWVGAHWSKSAEGRPGEKR